MYAFYHRWQGVYAIYFLPPKTHPHTAQHRQTHPYRDQCSDLQAATLYTIRARHPAADNDTSAVWQAKMRVRVRIRVNNVHDKDAFMLSMSTKEVQ